MQHRLRHSASMGVTRAPKSDSPISGIRYWNTLKDDGNTVFWYKFDELSTITKDVDNKVSLWKDFMGSGRDLRQATAGKHPIWSADGITGDGIAQFMDTADFVLNQPESIYIIFKQLSWTSGDYIFDGTATVYGALLQAGTSSGFRASAGVSSETAMGLGLNELGIARVFFNGTNSKIQINNYKQQNWNCGVNNMGAFTLFARGNGTAAYSNIVVTDIIGRKVRDTDQNEIRIYNYLNALRGINKKDSYNSNSFDNGKLLITFDDGKKTLNDVGVPLMDSKGVKATMYLVSDWTGVDNTTITWEQALTLSNAGYDMQCHSKTHSQETTLTEAQLLAELNAVNDAFTTNGLSLPQHHAYPGGNYNASVQAIVATLRKTARITGTVSVVYPKSTRYDIPSISIDNIDDAGVIAVKAAMDNAMIWKSGITLYGHGVSIAGAQYEVPVAHLEEIIDYAQLIGMDIITTSQLYALLK